MKKFMVVSRHNDLLAEAMNHVFGIKNWDRKESGFVIINEDFIESFSFQQLSTFGIKLESVK